jgi:hypothetical protein
MEKDDYMKEIDRLSGSDMDLEFNSPEKIEKHSKNPENLIFAVAHDIQKLQNESDGLRGAKGREEEAIAAFNNLRAKNAELSLLLRKVPHETQMQILQMLGRS